MAVKESALEGLAVVEEELNERPLPSKARRSRTATILIQAVLIFLSILYAFPLYWMIITALKEEKVAMQMPPQYWPHPIVWSNFFDAITYESKQLGYIPFVVYARNTLVLCALTVSGIVFS